MNTYNCCLCYYTRQRICPLGAAASAAAVAGDGGGGCDDDDCGGDHGWGTEPMKSGRAEVASCQCQLMMMSLAS